MIVEIPSVEQLEAIDVDPPSDLVVRRRPPSRRQSPTYAAYPPMYGFTPNNIISQAYDWERRLNRATGNTVPLLQAERMRDEL